MNLLVLVVLVQVVVELIECGCERFTIGGLVRGDAVLDVKVAKHGEIALLGTLVLSDLLQEAKLEAGLLVALIHAVDTLAVSRPLHQV